MFLGLQKPSLPIDTVNLVVVSGPGQVQFQLQSNVQIFLAFGPADPGEGM